MHLLHQCFQAGIKSTSAVVFRIASQDHSVLPGDIDGMTAAVNAGRVLPEPFKQGQKIWLGEIGFIENQCNVVVFFGGLGTDPAQHDFL